VQGRNAVLERGLIVAGFGAMFCLLPHAVVADDNQRFSDIGLLRSVHPQRSWAMGWRV
jgi:hypothetical protein